MLFDLRVVLAACLATFIFVAAGLGLMSGLRSPFKASAEGPRIAGPGLPPAAPLPLPETARGEEVTGTVADQRITPEPAAPQAQERVQERVQERIQETVQEKPQEKEPEKVRARETRAAPAKGKKQTITSLIEEDRAAHPAPVAKPKAKRRRAHPRPLKQQPQSTNPFSAFMNNQGATAPATTAR